MALPHSVLKKLLNLNSVVFDSVEVEETTVEKYGEEFTKKQLLIHARPYKSQRRQCPCCGKKCPGYDKKHEETESRWRAPNLNGVPVYICYSPERINCPVHGVLTEKLPWEDGSTRFTPGFNDEVAWMATQMNRTAIATYLGINWRTVGNCVKASWERLEPDVTERVHSGLRHICVDETSYRKGYEYITVVYDMDRNRVVWIHKGHGKHVFEEFCRLLTPGEREAIEIVAGDGAKWIDQCTEAYFPNASRCIDFFHVAQWANEALDKVRVSTARKAEREYNDLKAQYIKAEEQEAASREEAARALEKAREELAAMPKRGRPSARRIELREYISRLEKELSSAKEEAGARKPGRPRKEQFTPEHQAALDALSDAAKAIKGAKHALGHDPEKCTEAQNDKIDLIANNYPDLYRAYQLKESLRLILHMSDPELAAGELDNWILEAGGCGLKPMAELSEKISRHRENILNSVRHHANSSKSESTNTTIKVLIRMARGFWNMENMIALIYLKCSDLVVPLHNRPQMSPEYAAVLRKRAADRKRIASGIA